MNYKPGDIVIKKSGGNRMTVVDKLDNNQYKCIWFIENYYNECLFEGDEIVNLLEFNRYLKIEERDDKISRLFNPK